MRMETFITKALGLRAHRVVKIEEDEAARNLVVHLDRREHRRPQCGECGRGAGRIVPTRRPTRRWRDLALREHLVELASRGGSYPAPRRRSSNTRASCG